MAKGKSKSKSDDFGFVPVERDDFGFTPDQSKENPYDLMGRAKKEVSKIGSIENPLLELLLNKGAAAIGGAGSSASLGYAPEIYPESIKSAMRENPGSSFAGELFGGLVPGFGAAKATKAMGGGIKAAMLASGAEGAAYNPGKEGNRLTNAGIGLALGGLGSAVGKGAESLSDRYKLYKKLIGPVSVDERGLPVGPAREISEGPVSKAISNIREKQIKPRANEVAKLASEGEVTIGPSVLDKIREASPSGDRGGKGISGVIERKYGRTTPTGEQRFDLPGKLALKIRQRADQLADYRKAKSPLAMDANVAKSNELPKEVADILRQREEAINPRIKTLKEDQSQIYKLLDEAEKFKVSPLEYLKSGSRAGSGKRSTIQELSNLSGDDLTGLADRLSSAIDLSSDPSLYLSEPGILRSLIKPAMRGAGAVSTVLEKAPTGTRDALINAILEEKRKLLSR